MPAFDGTGPRGQGPMTGKGMGPCGKGNGVGRGAGFGCRRFMRRGLGRFLGSAQNWSQSDLENYKKALKEEMEDVDKEIESIKK